MKRYTMIARRPRQQVGARYVSHDDWRAPAEIGASTTRGPKTLDTDVECLKCGSVMELRHVVTHRLVCFPQGRGDVVGEEML